MICNSIIDLLRDKRNAELYAMGENEGLHHSITSVLVTDAWLLIDVKKGR